MSAAVDGLSTAAARLDEVMDSAQAAESALDGVSDALVDRVGVISKKAEEIRSSVLRALDALEQAGA